MNFDEPLPPFETRYPGKVEACLSAAFQTYGGQPLYFRFTRKAAVIFYGVIKNHPFINGNKRMAVMLTLTFFYENDRWLNVPPEALYKIAWDVAYSHPKDRDVMIDALSQFFNRFKS
jgi:death-on-curing family protein